LEVWIYFWFISLKLTGESSQTKEIIFPCISWSGNYSCSRAPTKWKHWWIMGYALMQIH